MRPTSRDVTFPTDPTNTPDDQDLLEQIKAVLPEAAVVRAQSTLDPSEWDVPIAHPQRLDNKGGIALVPKTLLPSVLQRVGYTAAPTAVLTSQPATDLGLKGFPQHQPGPLWDLCTHG